MSDADGDYDIYVMDSDGGNARRLTDNAVTDRMPAWSPDGQWIVFSSDTRGDGSHDLYAIHPDGSDLRQLYSDDERNSSPRWSTDGKLDRVHEREHRPTARRGKSSGWTWRRRDRDRADAQRREGLVAGVRARRQADLPDGRRRSRGDCAHEHRRRRRAASSTTATGYDWGASYSPSGDLITFTSDVSGRDEIYLMNADGTNVRQVTDLGGMGASWLPQ